MNSLGAAFIELVITILAASSKTVSSIHDENTNALFIQPSGNKRSFKPSFPIAHIIFCVSQKTSAPICNTGVLR